MKKILICFALLLALCACKASGPKAAVQEKLKEKANEISSEFDSYLDGDSAEFFGGDEELAKEFYKLLKDVDIKLGEEKIENDVASVEVIVTSYDFGKLISSYMQDLLKTLFASLFSGEYQEEDTNNLSAQLLKEKMDIMKQEGKTYTNTVLVACNKKDGVWVVDDDSLNNAIFASFADGLADFANAFSLE